MQDFISNFESVNDLMLIQFQPWNRETRLWGNTYISAAIRASSLFLHIEYLMLRMEWEPGFPGPA